MKVEILRYVVNRFAELQKELDPLTGGLGLDEFQIMVETATAEEPYALRTITLQLLPVSAAEGISDKWVFAGTFHAQAEREGRQKYCSVFFDPEDVTAIWFEDFSLEKNEGGLEPDGPVPDVITS